MLYVIGATPLVIVVDAGFLTRFECIEIGEPSRELWLRIRTVAENDNR
jgi:hypothetical protein